MEDDIMINFEDEESTKDQWWEDISLDSEDEEINLDDFNITETTDEEWSEDEDTSDQIDTQVESTETETDDEVTEDINFDELFSELSDANDAIDKIESNDTSWNTQEIWVLKQALNNMEQIVKKLTNEKSDLILKNAELTAFGWDDTDPKMLLLTRNFAKAIDWDERSKTKVVSTLKDLLYDLTWEDFDNEKINKDIDILTAAESYNSQSNPKLKAASNEDDWFSI